MKASDLALSLSNLDFNDPNVNPAKRVPQEEIDRINDLYDNIRRKGRQILKDAMELGDLLIKARKTLNPKGQGKNREVFWSGWLRSNCPKISFSTAYEFQKVALNREFIESISSHEFIPSVHESLRMIRQKDRTPKTRVRAVVVKKDAEPIVLLEAKLKNYVISLYLMRYLEVEIKGMLEAMALTPDQVLKVLHYVCKEHHEVEDEVLRTFRPGLKVVPKGA